MRISCLGGVLATLLPATLAAQIPPTLADSLDSVIAPSGATVAVALVDLGTRDTLFIQPDLRFHAASTMKVPVLIELARRIDAGTLHWDDTLPVRNQFRSIMDGSSYALDPLDDSDSSMYALVGQAVTLRHLARHMIDRSSNLATDLLIDLLDPKRVNATAHELGADSIEVLRGVEDLKAYDAGRNNTTTARDLARLFIALADGRAASPQRTREMLDILSAQEFNSEIPAGLPPGVRVAHKTGAITRLAHDAGIVYPAHRAPYVLVVLTRGLEPKDSAPLMAEISRRVWNALTGGATE